MLEICDRNYDIYARYVIGELLYIEQKYYIVLLLAFKKRGVVSAATGLYSFMRKQ